MMKNIKILVYNDVEWLNHRIAPVEINLNDLRKVYNIKDREIDNIQISNNDGNNINNVQIDRIDKNDPTKDVLIFMADAKEYPTVFTFSTSDTLDYAENNISKEIWDEDTWVFDFDNSRIMMNFDRGRGFDGYASGSSRDVLLKEKSNNVSDPFSQGMPAKMMQLEGINIRRFAQRWYFPSNDYEYISSGIGKLRTFLTIRQPIWIDFKRNFVLGPGKLYNRCNCSLYRVISMFHDKDYILEDVYIESENIENTKDKNVDKMGNIKFPIEFSAKFSSEIPGINQYMDIKEDYPIGCTKDIGWFAVGNHVHPKPGFGFASNSSIQNLKVLESSFTWTVSPSYRLRCLHQFMDETNTMVDAKTNFGHVVGSNWFNSIYKPLWAMPLGLSK